MEMEKVFEPFKAEDFIKELPTGIRNIVAELNEEGVSLEKIGNDIAASPSLGLTAKGGSTWNSGIFSAILKEIAEIVCVESEKHADFRKKLRDESGLTAKVLIALVAGYVAKSIGIAYSLCVPFVILGLSTIAKASYGVFCTKALQRRALGPGQ